jgi:hypothetical protein
MKACVILLTRTMANGVRVLQVAEMSDGNALLRPLARAFERKTASLSRARARGYTTALAVDVERHDAVGFLREGYRAPGFPSEIDHLWLVDRPSVCSMGGAMIDAFRRLSFPPDGRPAGRRPR